VKLLAAAAVLVAVLPPSSWTVSEVQQKRTLQARVAKLEREIRIMQNTVYLKGTGMLPLALNNKLDIERVEALAAGTRQDLLFCLRYRADRTAVISPVCLEFRPTE
jgi:hypothetical protein